MKVIASLLSPTAFALGSVNFADYEHAHVGLRWSNIWQVGCVRMVCLLFELSVLFAEMQHSMISAGVIWSEFFGLSPDDVG